MKQGLLLFKDPILSSTFSIHSLKNVLTAIAICFTLN